MLPSSVLFGLALNLSFAGSTEDLSDTYSQTTSSEEVDGPLQHDDSEDDCPLSDADIKARFEARQKALLVTFDNLKGTSLLLSCLVDRR